MIWTPALEVLRGILLTVFVFVLLVLILDATDLLPDSLFSLLSDTAALKTAPVLVRWAAAAFIYGILLFGSLGMSGVLVFYGLDPTLSTAKRFVAGGLLPVSLGLFFWLLLWTNRRRSSIVSRRFVNCTDRLGPFSLLHRRMLHESSEDFGSSSA